MIAEEAGIDVRSYQVIYDLVDDVQKAMVGMLRPIFEEAVLGHAEVRAIFKISRYGKIAGCYVTDGLIRRNAKVRVKRDGEVIHDGLARYPEALERRRARNGARLRMRYLSRSTSATGERAISSRATSSKNCAAKRCDLHPGSREMG